MELLHFLATALIGGMATWIAFMQADTNRKKYTLDRYDRRFAVYEATVSFLSTFHSSGLKGHVEFGRAKTHARVLFGPEVVAFLDEITERVIAFRTASDEYRDDTQPRAPNYDHEDIVRRQGDALEWLAKQIPEATNLFKRYLDISK